MVLGKYFSELYSAFEGIKNGMFVNYKYETQQVLMDPPHVVCFSNEVPDVSALSQDRWEVYYLLKGGLSRLSLGQLRGIYFVQERWRSYQTLTPDEQDKVGPVESIHGYLAHRFADWGQAQISLELNSQASFEANNPAYVYASEITSTSFGKEE